MADETTKGEKASFQRISFTARLSLKAYDALIEIQRARRRKSGDHTPLCKIVDAAITAYAEQIGIKLE